jgi:integrase
LAEAREKARECRKASTEGRDPIAERRAERMARRIEQAGAVTFAEAAERYIATHRASWRSVKYARQWVSTLETFVYPIFGRLPVRAVDTALVMKALSPIWVTKTETATRVRGRIEIILDWAKTSGYRTGDNPARWKGHLENLLPRPSKVAPIEHHAALAYGDVGAFVARLRKEESVSALAMEFLILTAARTKEVRLAAWSEFDLAKRLWTIPAVRIKGGREHRVPLSERVIEILEVRRAADPGGEFIFSGMRGKSLTGSTFWALLRRLGRPDLTTHGFRSCFSDWCSECTSFPAELREMALAHAIANKVEAAYRRGDLLEKRRRLAESWARFCETSKGSTVVPLRRAEE